MKILNLTNLPKPDNSVSEYILNYHYNSTGSDNKYSNHQFIMNKVLHEVYDDKINISLSVEHRPPKILFDKIQEQYQPYFKTPMIGSWFNILGNSNLSQGPACFPPHVHYGRTLAVNYFIDLGGDNVNTVFYSHYQADREPNSPQPVLEKYGGFLKYENVRKDTQYTAEKNKWYVHNSRIPHSVENITATRILFCLVFPATCEVADIMCEEKIEYSIVETE